MPALTKTWFLKSSSGSTGSAARRSASTKAPRATRLEGPEADDLGGGPGIGGAAQADHEHQCGQGEGQQAGTEVVDPVLDAGGHRGEGEGQHHQRQDPDGQVDVEDPAPREVGGQRPAEEGPDHRGQAEDGTEQPLVPTALTGRHHIADRRLGTHHQATPAQTLERPERDQLGEAVADPAEGRADQEDHQPDLEDDAASVLVAQFPVERGDHGLGQQVGGGHPRDVVEAPEVAGNGGQRGGHDGGVQRRHRA